MSRVWVATEMEYHLFNDVIKDPVILSLLSAILC